MSVPPSPVEELLESSKDLEEKLHDGLANESVIVNLPPFCSCAVKQAASFYWYFTTIFNLLGMCRKK